MIKYINCFGTSHTAGGGFEFNSNYTKRNEVLNFFYSDLKLPLTQFNFSYPGQLQTLLKNIKVTNYAKNGYGNDRVMRLAYEIIASTDFKSNEHIFLIEFGGIGRKEFWYEPLKDFVVMNYWVDWETNTLKQKVNLAKSYFYDSDDIQDLLKKEEPFFLEMYSKTFSLYEETQKYQREIDFFTAYLDSKNVNYFILTDILNNKVEKQFTFGDGIFFKKSKDFNKFTNLNNLEIDAETNYVYKDKHNGYVSNKIVAQTIFNSLIDLGHIKMNKIDIDYKFLKSIKLPKLQII